jgi:hypothetical protein
MLVPLLQAAACGALLSAVVIIDVIVTDDVEYRRCWIAIRNFVGSVLALFAYRYHPHFRYGLYDWLKTCDYANAFMRFLRLPPPKYPPRPPRWQ